VLKGNNVTLSSEGVARPLTARYAWAPAPLNANFVNSEGLPAAPFRTDTQPVPPRK
jgi:sialate O-acetylesterase